MQHVKAFQNGNIHPFSQISVFHFQPINELKFGIQADYYNYKLR